MFRELLRKNKKVTDEKCKEILANKKRGVLSVCTKEGYPYGMPMNHFFDEDEGCIYFHCGKEGHRLDCIKENPKVSFCVVEKGLKKENHWACNFNSVIVFGKIQIIDDLEIIEKVCRKLSYKFTSDEDYIEKEIKAFSAKTLLLKLNIEHICGKTVLEA
jgi:nitroimidazol reductase NimA-like FMN-containing flavoprotein (pyridoxamine 5'-phosphate oxidase superfamily)